MFFSFQRLFFLIFGFAVFTLFSATLIYFDGMPNFDSGSPGLGAPIAREIGKFVRPLRRSSSMKSVLQDDDHGKIVLVDPINATVMLELGKHAMPSTLSSTFNRNDVKNEMRKRAERVKAMCKKYHLGTFSWTNGSNDLSIKDPPTPLYSYMFFNRKHNLVWCPVYKAGSTSWLQNMMLLQGFTETDLLHPPKQLSIWAQEVYRDIEPDKDFEQAQKLLVVRHPFERLISAYRDKLSNSSTGLESGTAHFYEKYGKKIVQKFRKDFSKKLEQLEPTFEEFVRYLISTNLVYYADDHWLPSYLSCTPCRINYDYIAKVETYMQDQQYIIDQMNLSNIIRPRWQHFTSTSDNNNRRNGKKSQETVVQHYFSQLSQSQITSLYQKYYLDFQLFGYSYQNYLQYGKTNW